MAEAAHGSLYAAAEIYPPRPTGTPPRRGFSPCPTGTPVLKRCSTWCSHLWTGSPSKRVRQDSGGFISPVLSRIIREGTSRLRAAVGATFLDLGFPPNKKTSRQRLRQRGEPPNKKPTRQGKPLFCALFAPFAKRLR
jgi:hypothetical protein